ncbi:MAG: hypothetical protein JW736_02905, partial [Deltaproteobacteria bacterium]|nr:hypothetical protein [Deltaproteobacteria bacterium]
MNNIRGEIIVIDIKKLMGSAALGFTAALPLSALAADEAMLNLLRVLRDNGTISQEAYEVLRDSAMAEEGRPPAAREDVREEVRKEVEALTKDMPEINTKGKFEIKSRDGDFKWRLKGRIHADAAVHDNDGGTEFDDGADLRR